MNQLHRSIDKCDKGSFYLVEVNKGCYYTVMQHGQRTWVANCITHNQMEAQYFVGNSYAVIDQLKKVGAMFEIYRARSITDFRKGVMAVLVGISPDHEVNATDANVQINIGVMK